MPAVQEDCGDDQVARRHDAKAEADAEDPAAVRQSELARRKHEEQQEAENEDALAPHRLGNQGQEELLAFIAGREQSSGAALQRRCKQPSGRIWCPAT